MLERESGESMGGRDWVAWISPGLMILVGVVLFFIPVPPTSLIGIGLILVGAALWIIDFVSDDGRSRRDRDL